PIPASLGCVEGRERVNPACYRRLSESVQGIEQWHGRATLTEVHQVQTACSGLVDRHSLLTQRHVGRQGRGHIKRPVGGIDPFSYWTQLLTQASLAHDTVHELLAVSGKPVTPYRAAAGAQHLTKITPFTGIVFLVPGCPPGRT